MNTVVLERVEIKEADFHLFEELFRKFKVKYQEFTAKKAVKKDETKMSKEAFFAMVDEARAQKGREISDEELDKNVVIMIEDEDVLYKLIFTDKWEVHIKEHQKIRAKATTKQNTFFLRTIKDNSEKRYR